MDLYPMVNPDLDAGAELVAALKEQGLDVDVAAWVRDRERDAWRLILATPMTATAGRRAVYQAIESVLSQNPNLRERLPELFVVSSADPGVDDLRRLSVARPDSLRTSFPATTIAGEPFERGWVYNVAGVAYEHEVLRALQRVTEPTHMIVRRGEGIFGSDAGIDFIVDSEGAPVAIEVKNRLSKSAIDQLASLRLRLPPHFRMLVVSPDAPSLPRAITDAGVRHVRWQSPADDADLREALTRLLAA